MKQYKEVETNLFFKICDILYQFINESLCIKKKSGERIKKVEYYLKSLTFLLINRKAFGHL